VRLGASVRRARGVTIRHRTCSLQPAENARSSRLLEDYPEKRRNLRVIGLLGQEQEARGRSAPEPPDELSTAAQALVRLATDIAYLKVA